MQARRQIIGTGGGRELAQEVGGDGNGPRRHEAKDGWVCGGTVAHNKLIEHDVIDTTSLSG